MVSHLPILILLATSTYAADNFRNILNAIEGTSEGRSVLSNLPSQVLQNLAQNPQDAGEFVCYLMDGDATGAASFVGTTITAEVSDDWNALTSFCTSLPHIIEADLEAIVNGSNNAVDIVETFLQDPTAVLVEAASVVSSAFAEITSDVACLWKQCGTTAGIWQQLTSSCVSIMADATPMVITYATSTLVAVSTSDITYATSTLVAASTSAITYATSTAMVVSTSVVMFTTSTPIVDSASESTYTTSAPIVLDTSTMAYATSTPIATSTSAIPYSTSSTSTFSYPTTPAAAPSAQQTQQAYTAGAASQEVAVKGAFLALAVGVGALCFL